MIMITRIFGSIAFIAIAATLIACGNKVATNTSTNTNNRPASSPVAAANNNTAVTGGASDAPVTVTGKWEMVGKEGQWKNTVDMIGMDGFLWAVEKIGR